MGVRNGSATESVVLCNFLVGQEWHRFRLVFSGLVDETLGFKVSLIIALQGGVGQRPHQIDYLVCSLLYTIRYVIGATQADMRFLHTSCQTVIMTFAFVLRELRLRLVLLFLK